MFSLRHNFDFDFKCERPAETAALTVKALAESFELRLYRVAVVRRRLTFRSRWAGGTGWFRFFFYRGLVVVDPAPDGIRVHGWRSRARQLCYTSVYAAIVFIAMVLGILLSSPPCLFLSIMLGLLSAFVYSLESSQVWSYLQGRFDEAVRQSKRITSSF